MGESSSASQGAGTSGIVSQLADAHSANVTAIGFVKLTQGASMLYSVGEDGLCKLWEVRSQQLRVRRSIDLKDPINCATLLHNSFIVCGTQLGTIGIWSFNATPDVPMQNADGLIDTATYLNDDPAIRSLALTPGGDVVVAGTNSGRVLIFAIAKTAVSSTNGRQPDDADTAGAVSPAPSAATQQTATFPAVPQTADVPNASMHTGDSTAGMQGTIATKPLIQAGVGGVLRLVWSFEAHPRYILKCCVSPNGATLCTTSADTTVNLWKVPEELPRIVEDALTTSPLQPRSEKWTLSRTLTAHQRWVWDCAFSHCSFYLVTASSDHTGRLWQVETGKQEATFAGHQKPVTCIVLDDRRE